MRKASLKGNLSVFKYSFYGADVTQWVVQMLMGEFLQHKIHFGKFFFFFAMKLTEKKKKKKSAFVAISMKSFGWMIETRDWKLNFEC